MKYILVILPALLVGCVAGFWLGHEAAQVPPLMSVMPESAKNRPCERIREFEIFQALREGGLAHGCETISGHRVCRGQLAFISNQRGMEFFDGKIVRVTQGKCFVFDGVYRYTDRERRERNVPMVWIRER